jgi:uncharacterized membrane protein SpoIIM required for sporulation
MRQQQFEQTHEPLWAEYRLLLQRLERGPGGVRWRRTARERPPPDVRVERLPRLLRSISGHYALARSRGYSPGLVEELHQLVRRGYRQLYRPRPRWPALVRDFMLGGFPRALRRHASAFWLACALFFGPMLAMGLACAQDPALVYSLLEPAQVADLEAMYDPTNARLGRQADDDVAAFGFYVMNNVGIAFRTFAAGLLFGAGSLFILGFNGLFIGAAAGHLTRLGMGEPFWSFVSGHAPFELTAIAVSGAAGLLLARALLAPGPRTRLAALRLQAAEAVPLVAGAMLMLLLAAVIEAFWSASTAIPATPKYLAGAGGWALVAAYLLLAGRSSTGETDDGA